MRHRNSGRKLGRTASHRTALFRNMATSLFRHERIETTDAKAKELRSFAEQLITVAKRGVAAGGPAALHARRLAAADIADKDVLKKLFDTLAPRFAARPGGYVRIIKAGFMATPMTVGKAPALLCASPRSVARDLLRRPNRRGIEYLPWWWSPLMRIICLLPAPIACKL